MSPHFERVAREVSRRAAELLGAHTVVVDTAQDIVVASSDANLLGRRFEGLRSNTNAPADGAEPPRVDFRVGGQEGQVIVGAPWSGESLSPRLTQGVVELVISQARAQDELPEARELKHTFIHDRLRGVPEDEDVLLRQARILGMDLAPPRAVILIDAGGFVLAGDGDAGRGESGTAQSNKSADPERAARRAQLVIGSVVGFFKLPNDTICGYIGEGEVAVLKASDTRSLASWLEGDPELGPSWANLAALKRASAALLSRLRADTGTPISIGLGRYHRGIDGLARSYQDARAALSLGRRLPGGNHVHSLDALGIAAFVGVPDERTKIELARHLLSPLDAEPELLGTLHVFFREDCQPLRTARALGIHRNTLTYRLDKIGILTGIDPRRFDDAVQMRLAMLLREFHKTDAAD